MDAESVTRSNSSERELFQDNQVRRLKAVDLPPLPDEPFVSVLIANYNYGRFLPEAIESVLAQTHQSFEIVVCDDGSTDESRRVLKEYAAKCNNVKTLFQENKGQAEAMLATFHASRGEILCFLDSDDTFSKTKLTEVIRTFREAPEVGLVIHRLSLTDSSGRRVRQVPAVAELPMGWKGPQMSLTSPQMLWGMPPMSGISLRRLVAERVFPHFRGHRMYADLLIQVAAPLKTAIASIGEPLGCYRVHGQNEYARKEFTADDLERKMLLEAELWSAWRSFMMELKSELPPGFSIPVECPPSVFSYATARFKGERDSKNLYLQSIANPGFTSMPWAYRAFWRFSVFLPDKIFKQCFNFIYGKGATKDWLSRIVEAMRSAASSRSA